MGCLRLGKVDRQCALVAAGCSWYMWSFGTCLIAGKPNVLLATQDWMYWSNLIKNTSKLFTGQSQDLFRVDCVFADPQRWLRFLCAWPAWHGLTWLDMAWHGLTWLDMAWPLVRMFSATFPKEIQTLAMDFLDPKYYSISVGTTWQHVTKRTKEDERGRKRTKEDKGCSCALCFGPSQGEFVGWSNWGKQDDYKTMILIFWFLILAVIWFRPSG